MSVRAASLAVVLLLCACPKRVAESRDDYVKRVAGGTVVNAGGPKKYPGSEVAVEVRFKDGSPNCVMMGAVQFARDDTHRWAWLEATEGCPEWLGGRWWGELASGGTGWYLQDLSTTAVEETR